MSRYHLNTSKSAALLVGVRALKNHGNAYDKIGRPRVGKTSEDDVNPSVRADPPRSRGGNDPSPGGRYQPCSVAVFDDTAPFPARAQVEVQGYGPTNTKNMHRNMKTKIYRKKSNEPREPSRRTFGLKGEGRCPQKLAPGKRLEAPIKPTLLSTGCYLGSTYIILLGKISEVTYIPQHLGW